MSLETALPRSLPSATSLSQLECTQPLAHVVPHALPQEALAGAVLNCLSLEQAASSGADSFKTPL